MKPINHNLQRLFGVTQETTIIQKSEDPQIEKGGKRAQIGEMRIYGGQKWVKHTEGWVHVSEDGKKALLERPGGKRETAQIHHVEHFHKNSPKEENKSQDSIDGFKVGDKIVWDPRGYRHSGEITGLGNTGKILIKKEGSDKEIEVLPEHIEKQSSTLITQAMIEYVSSKKPASDKDILGNMRVFASSADNTYTESEYGKMLEEYKDSNNIQARNSHQELVKLRSKLDNHYSKYGYGVNKETGESHSDIKSKIEEHNKILNNYDKTSSSVKLTKDSEKIDDFKPGEKVKFKNKEGNFIKGFVRKILDNGDLQVEDTGITSPTKFIIKNTKDQIYKEDWSWSGGQMTHLY